MKTKGKVFLVGAGPGDPKLLTIKGLEAIQKADVIVYDRLVNSELIKYAEQKVELIYCGKMPNQHTIPQHHINEILVYQAKRGKRVVRLKGGDPCMFGRGGEEAEFCAEHHIEFEFIPGITSGISAPMYAGIPVTHRDYSSSVTFITGHKRTDKKSLSINWEQLAPGGDTLVFYMGLSNLAMICEKLMQYGRTSSTPVALVQHGTTIHQRTVVGDLSTIVEKAAEAKIQSPAIIVVGEVVKLREQLAWFGEESIEEFSSLQESNIS
ncbi:uroporphyrinogen-III C-methyltransferase [Alkalihalobacterium alkalinitrilicum]|uniref:uroporphyrinogen-III C-methyltransferase n=1 Tax=Alkalihalobacterium alkalinitrilicum TaxID=427920 RepID=UPI00099499CB|nr:uroporphyrinogen-III C-methyltransferase [Alkalihalobacterium alkalinitrilicum]